MPSPQIENFTDKQLADFARLHEQLRFELADVVRKYLGRMPQSYILGAMAHIDMATRACMTKETEENHAKENN